MNSTRKPHMPVSACLCFVHLPYPRHQLQTQKNSHSAPTSSGDNSSQKKTPHQFLKNPPTSDQNARIFPLALASPLAPSNHPPHPAHPPDLVPLPIPPPLHPAHNLDIRNLPQRLRLVVIIIIIASRMARFAPIARRPRGRDPLGQVVQ